MVLWGEVEDDESVCCWVVGLDWPGLYMWVDLVHRLICNRLLLIDLILGHLITTPNHNYVESAILCQNILEIAGKWSTQILSR